MSESEPKLWAKVKLADTKWCSAEPFVVDVKNIVKRSAGCSPTGHQFYESFTPQHHRDFVSTTLYLIKLDENRADGKLNPYHCQIGAISEHKEELERKRISWPVIKEVINEPDSSAVEDEVPVDAVTAVKLQKVKRLGAFKPRSVVQSGASNISKKYLSASRLSKASAAPLSTNVTGDSNVLEELKRLKAELAETREKNMRLLKEKEETEQRLAEERRQKNLILLKENEDQQRLTAIQEATIRKVLADEMAKREEVSAALWRDTLIREMSGFKREMQEITDKINNSIREYNPSTSYVLEWVNSIV